VVPRTRAPLRAPAHFYKQIYKRRLMCSCLRAVPLARATSATITKSAAATRITTLGCFAIYRRVTAGNRHLLVLRRLFPRLTFYRLAWHEHGYSLAQ